MNRNDIRPNMELQAEWNDNGTSRWDNVMVHAVRSNHVDIIWTTYRGQPVTLDVQLNDGVSTGWTFNHLRRRPLRTDIIGDQYGATMFDATRIRNS